MEVTITICVFLSIFSYSYSWSDLTIDEYNDLINSFISKTQSYQQPTSSRAFVSGTLNEAGNYYDYIHASV